MASAARRDATATTSETAILAAIIASAFVARALAIWVGRPEFVGWFNHSYYYWVQVQGLLENNQLPCADLPLLFHLYATVASLFQLFGLELQQAIVHSTRLIMSLTPALIAYPTYLTVRRIHGRRRLASAQWFVVTLSALLPLTFAHMPELLVAGRRDESDEALSEQEDNPRRTHGYQDPVSALRRRLRAHHLQRQSDL